MRWSQTFIPTLKESPAEADLISHKLMLRAGLIRKLTGGLYTLLPLGLRAMRKVERIIREEMDGVGAREILMPTLQPREIRQQPGCYEDVAGALYKGRDRMKKEWILCPTAEEIVTKLVANEIDSYRQLPASFYQISVKFRDEVRPRFGMMRAKEFVMKDAYSFDASDDAAMTTYQNMYATYQRIFNRCGLKIFPVEAAGLVGGSCSHEFMAPTKNGENEVIYCEACSYSANVENARSALPPTPIHSRSDGKSEEPIEPGVVTLTALLNPLSEVPAHRQINVHVYLADDEPVLMLLRGDHQLNEAKAVNVLRRSLGAQRIDRAGIWGAHRAIDGSYLHFHPDTPHSQKLSYLWKWLTELASDDIAPIKSRLIYADEPLVGATDMLICVEGHPLPLSGEIRIGRGFDLRLVHAGEPCTNCGNPLKIRRAIELGHISKLNTKYSKELGASFLANDGQRQPCLMGCYRIGVTRTLQAVIEQSNDEHGIVWPVNLAPYAVCLTPLSVAPESAVMKVAETLYSDFKTKGVEVILDDREARPGVKLTDADLVGFPIRIGIGQRSLAKNQLELKRRDDSTVKVVRTKEAVAEATRLLDIITHSSTDQ